MDQSKLDTFKAKLEEEKGILLEELNEIGQQDPQNPANWDPKGSDVNEREQDPNKRADNIENFEAVNAIITQLEYRLNEVNDALARMEEGTYGICEVSGEPIEEARLEANPAARTSIAHMNDK